MAKTTIRLESLREKQAQLQARISKLENREKQQARKDDTRLKILIGAAMLADTAHHPETGEFVRAVLARAITTERDQDFLRAMGWF